MTDGILIRAARALDRVLSGKPKGERAYQFGGGGRRVWRVTGPIAENYPAIYGATPTTLRNQLMILDEGSLVRWYARRLARSNEHIGRFLDRACQTAFFADRTELPAMPGAPGELAGTVARLWLEWWRSPIGSDGRTGEELERMAFRDWLVDGELFLEWMSAGRVRVLPSDLVADFVLATTEHAVSEWVLPSGNKVARDALIQVAWRQSGWELRGRSYLAKALVHAWANMEFRDNAGAGTASVSKIAALHQNDAPADARRLPTLGGGSEFDDMEIGVQSGQEAAGVRPAIPMQPGIVRDLPMGQKMALPEYGPPEAAMKFSDEQMPIIAIALGVSETELTGDHAKHNFASLQVAEVRDIRTYQDIRQQWYRTFRAPLFRCWLDYKIASGEIPAMEAVTYYPQLTQPRWAGPRILSAQPIKDMQALEKQAQMGLVNLKRIGASQGENVMVNAEENAEIMAHATGAQEPEQDVGEAVKDAMNETAK